MILVSNLKGMLKGMLRTVVIRDKNVNLKFLKQLIASLGNLKNEKVNV